MPLLVQHGIQRLFFQYYFLRLRLMATTLRLIVVKMPQIFQRDSENALQQPASSAARERRCLNALNAATNRSHTPALTA